MNEKLQEGVELLAEQGLNLAAVFDCATLPVDVLEVMGVPVEEYRRLLLLGHGGQRFWRALNEFGWHTADPVDHFSIHLTETFLRDYLGNPPYLCLYPLTEYMVPLQRLGELAGWCHPSPLGLGISPTYGLWFAYRAAFLVDADLPVTTSFSSPSPCDTCADKPCITTCPSGAVRLAGFDVFKCSHFRLQENSPCHDRCLARLACPAAPEHRYELEQVQYHYGRSLQTIRTYFE
jgi:ferredoxin